MPCYLPFPYEDELLYSVIARYLIYMKVTNIPVALKDIFGRAFSRPRVTLPGCLDFISKSTIMTWNMSSQEIAENLTLFPYYSRYLPKKRAAHCFDELCSNNSLRVPSMLGITQQKSAEFLRFCLSCRNSDLLKNGETFWRRSHQLQGVLVCPEHGEFLVHSRIALRPSGSKSYFDATINTEEIASVVNSELDKSKRELLHNVARRCQKMLWGPIKDWEADELMPAYRHAAYLRGFGQTISDLKQTRLEASFTSFYSEKLLSMLDLNMLHGNDNWLRTIFRTHRTSFPPLKHALVQIFLENMPIVNSIKVQLESKPARYSLIKKRRSKNKIAFNKRISILRKEWKKLLEKIPNRCPDQAYEINPKLYMKLLHNDKEWLYASGGRLKIKSPYKPHIDWVRRDKEWSEKLKIAAMRLLNSPKRVTKTAILNEAGLSKVYSFLDRLPLCTAILNEHREPIDDWRERRMRALHEEAHNIGKVLRPYMLKKIIKNGLISSRIENLIMELCSE